MRSMGYGLALLTLCGTTCARAVELARGGQALCPIVVAADAIAAERTAAGQLAEALRQASGGTFEVRDPTDVPEDAVQIIVGPSERARALVSDIDFDSLGPDEIVIRTVGDALVLAGGRPRGTIYAVNTFLEDTVGFRWWTSTESFTPSCPDLSVTDLSIRYAPPLMSREVFFKDAFEPVFATRLRVNGHAEPIPEELGGHIELVGWCHTFWSLLPPDQYFAEHPEWYSEIDGQRTADGSQICLTNEEARKEVTRHVLGLLRERPGTRLISVSQNDWHGRCQCAACQAVEAEEGSPSGPLIRFVNAVAEDVEAEFPDVLVETLAYQYTRKAPEVTRPRDNVVVRLCSIECDFSQPLLSERNADFASDIDAWSKIARNLYIWNYVVNFANFLIPHPNFRAFGDDVRFFVDHGAVSIFEQGDAYSRGGDWNELRAWVLAHLLWDPSLDSDALIREFVQGYYGPAAPDVLRCIETMHQAVANSGARLGCFHANADAWLTLPVLIEATQALEDAQAAVADDPDLSARVRRARIPFDHVWLLKHGEFRIEAQLEGLPFLAPETPAEAYERFVEALDEAGTGYWGEGRPLETYLPTLKMLCSPNRTTAAPPPECEGLARADWVDVQDTSFALHNLGAWVAIEDDADASDGGAARMPGWSNQWAVQWPVASPAIAGKRWHVYVVAKCDPVATEGQAFTVGLYDQAAGQGIAQRAVTLADAGDGQYHTYDLGAHDLPQGAYVWIAPPGDESLVRSVSVDRIFLVREEE